MVDVAVLAERQPVVCQLEAVLWEHGLHTMQRDQRVLQADPLQVLHLLHHHHPSVVIAVVDPPEAASWAFLERLRPVLASHDCFLVPVVLNRTTLELEVGPTDLVELTADEADLQRVAALAKAGWAAAHAPSTAAA